MTLSLNSTLDDILNEKPAAAAVLEKLGIDYCCAGNVSLGLACRDRGADPQAALEAIRAYPGLPGGPQRSAEDMTPTELTDHIEETHHAYLWDEMDRLDALSAKVARVHGQSDPRLIRLRESFLLLAHELSEHMLKEEQILFPLIRRIEAEAGSFESHCGTVANPIRKMDADHADAEAMFLTLRGLCDDYSPPDFACGSYRSLLEGLSRMEADLREHMRKESRLLFPRILELERRKFAT